MPETLGELSHKAAKDTTKYCAFEVADEMVKDIEAQVLECVARHRDILDVDQFCVVMLIAGDPLLHNMVRRKFYAWPFLPKPRTNQTVWMFDRRSETVRMLWCLPHADTVATLSMMVTCDPAYKNMARWSRSFYTTRFWHDIRKEHDIKMLSEEEHLEVIRKKDTKLVGDDCSPLPTNPIDSMRFNTDKVVDS